MTEKPFPFHYGWDHFWYDPVCVKNLAVREFVRGPFAKHKLVCSIPFVTCCQQDGTPVELREGIPDSWADYLEEKLGFYRKHSRNYELMHKENADVVPHLRKYRLYIGQGIPDPWSAYYYNPDFFPHLKDTERRKHSKNKKEERCLCCEREYLYQCPDKCISNVNRCSCKDCHGKNSSRSDSTDKCRCNEIFHNWMLANSRRRRRGGSSGDCLSSPNGSHSGTDDEGRHLKGLNKFVAFCECSGSDTSGLGGGDHKPYVKMRKYCQKNDKFFKHYSKVCFCPYIKHFCRRESLESDKRIGKPKISKEIQTEIPAIKFSKTVQTEKPGTKAQVKCTCRSKCFPCSVLCTRSWIKSGCPALHSFPNFCCSPVFTQKPTFVCPYSFANHLPVYKQCNNETGEIKKRHKKKKKVKEKDSDEGSNAHLKFDQPEVRVDRDSPVPKSKPKEDFHETTESLDHLKCYKNVDNSQPPSTTLDHMKFLANYKLKGYLYQEEGSPGVFSNKFLQQSSSTGSKYKNFFSSSSNNLKQEESPLEKFKPISCYRYSDSTFHGSKMNMRHSNFSNVRRFSCCNQATMTSPQETENLKSNVSVTKESVHKEVTESDETKTKDCGFLRNHEITQILRKRRKLLRNRKRRRKLVTSVLAHQDSSTKSPKQKSNAKNEVQVEEFPQDNLHLKRYSSRNFTSASDHLDASENTDLRFTGTILNSRYKPEVLKKHLGMFSSCLDQNNSVT